MQQHAFYDNFIQNYLTERPVYSTGCRDPKFKPSSPSSLQLQV